MIDLNRPKHPQHSRRVRVTVTLASVLAGVAIRGVAAQAPGADAPQPTDIGTVGATGPAPGVSKTWGSLLALGGLIGVAEA